MSSMLNQKCALTKLRAELEGRKGKMCFSYKRFRHLACNCRNKGEEGKKTLVPQNRFKVLSSRIMRCGIEIGKQEEEKRKEEAVRVVRVVRPQKEK